MATYVFVKELLVEVKDMRSVYVLVFFILLAELLAPVKGGMNSNDQRKNWKTDHDLWPLYTRLDWQSFICRRVGVE